MARILVVDDEPACRDASCVLLEMRGYEVDTVSDGPSAIEACRRNRPDLVIIDWMLRDEMDGTALAAELTRQWPGLPTLLITGYPAPEAQLKIKEIPRARWLQKPVAPSDLLAAVESATA